MSRSLGSYKEAHRVPTNIIFALYIKFVRRVAEKNKFRSRGFRKKIIFGRFNPKNIFSHFPVKLCYKRFFGGQFWQKIKFLFRRSMKKKICLRKSAPSSPPDDEWSTLEMSDCQIHIDNKLIYSPSSEAIPLSLPRMSSMECLELS